MTGIKVDREMLERFYKRFARREYISPDPLQFVHAFPNSRDKEIAGLLSAVLAYGNVRQILNSLTKVFSFLGKEPSSCLLVEKDSFFQKKFSSFKHRFTTGEQMLLLFAGIRGVLQEYGSLNRCFKAGYKPGHANMIPALGAFIRALDPDKKLGFLLSHPENGSACKRLNLYLRWMIRKDEVDPGCWQGLPPSKLLVPLDTHLYRFSKQLDFTRRKSMDFRTVLEISKSFAKFCPEDPVRYDFALTRFGIHQILKKQSLSSALSISESLYVG